MKRASSTNGRGVENARALRHWIARAAAGELCVYWAGDLASARKRSETAKALGREAYRAAADGLVRLVQARRSDEGFDYVAVRTGKGVA